MKEKIEECICKILAEKGVGIKPKLFIVPGIGTFNINNKRFIHREVKGGTSNYYNAIYYNTFNTLNNINDSDNEIDIYLDITHGINYMPVLCKDAVSLAANAYAATTGKRVKVITCNSDPLHPPPKEDDKNIILHLNTISQVEYSGYKSAEELLLRFVTDYLINKNHYINTLLRLIENIKREDIEKVYKVAKAFTAGIVMILTKTKAEIANYKRMFEDKLEKEPLKDGNIHENGQDIFFKYENSDSRIALLHSITSVLDSVSLNIDNDAVTLDQLEDVSNKYYKNVIDSVYYIVSKELDDLKRYKDLGDTYILYGKLKYKDGFDESKAGTTNSRILYAHAGLEENVTWVKKVNDQIYITYRDYFEKVLESI